MRRSHRDKDIVHGRRLTSSASTIAHLRTLHRWNINCSSRIYAAKLATPSSPRQNMYVLRASSQRSRKVPCSAVAAEACPQCALRPSSVSGCIRASRHLCRNRMKDAQTLREVFLSNGTHENMRPRPPYQTYMERAHSAQSGVHTKCGASRICHEQMTR
jgi:hypothetical protein